MIPNKTLPATIKLRVDPFNRSTFPDSSSTLNKLGIHDQLITLSMFSDMIMNNKYYKYMAKDSTKLLNKKFYAAEEAINNTMVLYNHNCVARHEFKMQHSRQTDSPTSSSNNYADSYHGSFYSGVYQNTMFRGDQQFSVQGPQSHVENQTSNSEFWDIQNNLY